MLIYIKMEDIELSKKYFNKEDELIEEVYEKHKKNDDYKIQGKFNFEHIYEFKFWNEKIQ